MASTTTATSILTCGSTTNPLGVVGFDSLRGRMDLDVHELKQLETDAIQAKRQRAAEVDDEADTEYWNAVANGLSEAAEIVAEAEPNE